MSISLRRGIRPAGRKCAVLLLVATLSGGGAVQAAPQSLPICHAIAVSPGFARDGTAFCYYHEGGSEPVFQFYVSTDGIRTWRRSAASGLVLQAGAAVLPPLVSPQFATDRTVYLSTASGLYSTTDLGESFTLASPVLGSISALYLDEMIPGQGYRVTLATPYSAAGPMRAQPPVHVPAAGSPADDRMFLFSPTFRTDHRAFVLAEKDLDPTLDVRWQSAIYACDAQLTCNSELYVFPEGHTIVRGYVPPDFATSNRMWMLTSQGSEQHHLWVSSDGGKHFREDPTTAALGRKARKDRTIQMSLAFATSRRLFLRWYGGITGAVNQLLRSDDGGATWKTIGSNIGAGQAKPRGNLPWHYTVQNSQFVLHAPTDRILVTLGSDEYTNYVGVFCSRDLGRTWRRTCA